MQNRCTQNPFLNLPVSYFFPTLFKPISFFDKSFYQYHLFSRCFIYNPVSSGSSRNYKRFGIIKALPHSFASLHPYCFPFHHHPNLATPFGFYFHRIFDGIPMDIVKMLFMGRQMFECIMFVFFPIPRDDKPILLPPVLPSVRNRGYPFPAVHSTDGVSHSNPIAANRTF